jgi:hypothetical protein
MFSSLEALRRYDMLDTPPEKQFDRVVRLATRWFEVPMSLVTLLDEDRQWSHGLRWNRPARNEPRDLVLCL